MVQRVSFCRKAIAIEKNHYVTTSSESNSFDTSKRSSGQNRFVKQTVTETSDSFEILARTMRKIKSSRCCLCSRNFAILLNANIHEFRSHVTFERRRATPSAKGPPRNKQKELNPRLDHGLLGRHMLNAIALLPISIKCIRSFAGERGRWATGFHLGDLHRSGGGRNGWDPMKLRMWSALAVCISGLVTRVP